MTGSYGKPARAEKLLGVALSVAVLDTAYLSWRYIALHAEAVVAGTGLCSWTEGIDCDQVLLTPQARAFYVPNALLGFGFFFGCLLWWFGGRRWLGAAYQHHLTRTLVFWLGAATLFTFRFWQLLLGLDHLCPLCPWNHLFTWIAFAASVVLWRDTPAPDRAAPVGPLARHVAICVSQFFLWLVLWQAAFGAGWLTP
jgi:uncharacterized membrane protein